MFLYRENAGLLALTRVGSRRVVQISAGFMIFFSVLGRLICENYQRLDVLLVLRFKHVVLIIKIYHYFVGKFGAVFASIPGPIIAALYCLFFGYVGMYDVIGCMYDVIGWRTDFWYLNSFDSVISSSKWQMKFNCARAGAGGLTLLQFCNLNSFRTKFILGFSIFIGLSVPQYFNEYTAINGFGPVHTSGRWVCIKLFDSFTSRPWFNLFIKPCQYWFLLMKLSCSSTLAVQRYC